MCYLTSVRSYILLLAHSGRVVLAVSGVTAVSGIRLSASGTTARFPGLYTISIGVSASFSCHRDYLLFNVGYVIKCCNGTWSDKTTIRYP